MYVSRLISSTDIFLSQPSAVFLACSCVSSIYSVSQFSDHAADTISQTLPSYLPRTTFPNTPGFILVPGSSKSTNQVSDLKTFNRYLTLPSGVVLTHLSPIDPVRRHLPDRSSITTTAHLWNLCFFLFDHFHIKSLFYWTFCIWQFNWVLTVCCWITTWLTKTGNQAQGRWKNSHDTTY